MTPPTPARRWVSDLRRAASWHRRKLAVLAAIAAVLTGLTALAPPDPPTVAVVRAEVDLPAGAPVTAGDVSVAHLPREAVPRASLTEAEAIVGRSLAAPVSEGQVLTAAVIISGRARRAPPGRVVAPLRLADGDVSRLLAHGDVVDVLAAGEQGGATVIASGVRVVSVPAAPDDPGPGTGPGGAVVLLEVERSTATKLARAAVVAQLSVVWR